MTDSIGTTATAPTVTPTYTIVPPFPYSWLPLAPARKKRAKSHIKESEIEGDYKACEVAAMMNVSIQWVYDKFENEKGVLKRDYPEKLRKRSYRFFRIPREVYQRVRKRMTI